MADLLLANTFVDNLTHPFEHILHQKPIQDLTTNEYNAMLLGLAHGVLQQE